MTQKSFRKTSIGNRAPEVVNTVIEIPKGSHNKYEYDEELDVFSLDRVLHSPLHYPADYGFIPETRADDGDHLDIMVIGGDPTFPGCLLRARAIGIMKMIDGGEKDYKVLAVQEDNTRFDKIQELDDIKQFNPHFLDETAHFFESYKYLEGKEVEIKGWGDKKEAIQEIEETYKNYKEDK